MNSHRYMRGNQEEKYTWSILRHTQTKQKKKVTLYKKRTPHTHRHTFAPQTAQRGIQFADTTGNSNGNKNKNKTIIMIYEAESIIPHNIYNESIIFTVEQQSKKQWYHISWMTSPKEQPIEKEKKKKWKNEEKKNEKCKLPRIRCNSNTWNVDWIEGHTQLY